MSANREETAIEQETARATDDAPASAPASETDALDALIPDVSALAAPHPRASTSPAEPRLRTARLVAVRGREAEVVFRRAQAAVVCEIAPEVEPALLDDLVKHGGSVLVEEGGDEEGVALVVGVLATRLPRSLELKAATVTIEAEREILLRSGRGAIRIREDGDIEVVGTRISATSRGLFRLVGRLLRLN